MADLFFRIASQALQAFLPIGVAVTAFKHRGRTDLLAPIRRGVMAAAVLTPVAGWLFQHSLRQSLWEAALAVLALAVMAWAIRIGARDGRVPPLVPSAAAALLITRQTMEIAVVIAAAVTLRSRDATLTIGAALAVGIGAAGAWVLIADRLDTRDAALATRIFLVLYLSQLAMYAFHESAEARLLPWSDSLHAATEAYGPDGLYGRQFSWLLIAAPLTAALARASKTIRYGMIGVCAVLVAASGALWLGSTRAAPIAAEEGVTAMARQPHLLFRHTLADQQYNHVEIAPLDGTAGRIPLGLQCERVAFAAGHGICLQAQRAVFTTYRAVVFDHRFEARATIALAGSPSRARVASDGRVGAATVFVTGHGYGSPFSTKTTLFDMATGDVLGDLEQFSAWRDGIRLRAADINYWGVTFGPNREAFFATMSTAGRTYLVRGDLALRTLTVVREGVECPSLSPDGRLIAFKKRVDVMPDHWRLAILEVATGTERLVESERRYVDDQAEWLDDRHVLYAIARPGSAATDVWVAPVNGAGPARIFVPGADSPAVVPAGEGRQ